MKASSYQLAVLLLSGCLTSSAMAGTVVRQVELAPGNAQSPKQTTTLYMDAGKLRVESGDASGQNLLIFDESKQVTWMIDLSERSYMEFTKAQVDQLATQMQGVATQMQQAMQQMQAQMADMPPEQRAMMEQMMKGRMGGMMAAQAPQQTTVREKAKGEKIGQFTCTRYEILTGSQLSQEVCAAPASALQLDGSAMATFRALAKFYEPLTRMAASFAGNWAAPSGLDQIEGFPVQTVLYSNQKPTSEWRVESAESRTLEASLFELPAGLTKKEMPQMPASR